MPSTRHAIFIILAVLAILVGLLVAVKVFAPDEDEFEPLPAAVFSAVREGTVYTVSAFESETRDTRALLLEKLETSMTAQASTETLKPELVEEREAGMPPSVSADAAATAGQMTETATATATTEATTTEETALSAEMESAESAQSPNADDPETETEPIE